MKNLAFLGTLFSFEILAHLLHIRNYSLLVYHDRSYLYDRELTIFNLEPKVIGIALSLLYFALYLGQETCAALLTL